MMKHSQLSIKKCDVLTKMQTTGKTFSKAHLIWAESQKLLSSQAKLFSTNEKKCLWAPYCPSLSD